MPTAARRETRRSSGRATPAAAARRAAGGRSSPRGAESPRFRPAHPEDVPRILPLMRALYAHDRLEFDEKAARRALLGLLEAPRRGRVFLVESGGALCGYIVLTLGWSLEYRGMDA